MMANETSFRDLLWGESTMEITGYRVLDIYCPLEHEQIRAVKEAISSRTLDGPLESNYGEPSFHWDGEQEETKRQFKSFMENGIDVGPFPHLKAWQPADCSFRWMPSSEVVYGKAIGKWSTNPYVSFVSCQIRRSSVQREPIPVQTLFQFSGPLRDMWIPKTECLRYIQALILSKQKKRS